MAKIIFSKGSVGSNLVSDPGMELDDGSWDAYGESTVDSQSSTEAHSGTYSRKAIVGPTGANLISDPSMELDDGSWIAYFSPTSQAQSSDFAHSGTYSRKIVLGGTTGGISSSPVKITTETSSVYVGSIWIYQATGGNITIAVGVRKGDDSGVSYLQGHSVPTGVWTEITFEYTETAGGALAYVYIYNTAGSLTFYVDDVGIALKEPLGGITGSPAPFTTSTGSTYSGSLWLYNTGVEQDFTVNVRNGANSADIYSVAVSIPQNVWTEVTFEIIESSGGSGSYIYVYAETDGLVFYMDDVDYHLIPSSFTFSVARVFPINDPLKTNVIIDYSDGGQLYAYNKGIVEQFFNLEFKRLSENDYDGLLNWYQNISVGALTTFTYTDEDSVDHTVRWLSAPFSILEHEKKRYTGSIQLREEV